jgi:hypothetical protein
LIVLFNTYWGKAVIFLAIYLFARVVLALISRSDRGLMLRLSLSFISAAVGYHLIYQDFAFWAFIFALPIPFYFTVGTKYNYEYLSFIQHPRMTDNLILKQILEKKIAGEKMALKVNMDSIPISSYSIIFILFQSSGMVVSCFLAAVANQSLFNICGANAISWLEGIYRTAKGLER